MLTDFIVTIGNVCVRRFQVVYPASLLLIPGLVFRGSDSAMVRALAWSAIALALALVCAAVVARPTQKPCTVWRDQRTWPPPPFSHIQWIGKQRKTGSGNV